jgi:hypothetical protein
MYAYRSLNWRLGATKNAIVLTDATYHSPDKYGTTLQQVVQRSKQIDPVNTFVLVADYTAEDDRLQSLASKTDGAVYSIDFDQNADNQLWQALHELSSHPVAVLPFAEYYLPPGQSIFLDASLSYGVVAPLSQYEFDCDADGTYEFSSPDLTSATCSYPLTTKTLVVVRVTDADGRVGTMSAVVHVTDSPPSAAEPDNPLLSTNHSDPEESEETHLGSSPQDGDDEANDPATASVAQRHRLDDDPSDSPIAAAPSTGLPPPSFDFACVNLLFALIAGIIFLLWIRKRFWSQGGRGISAATP